jgi:type IV pili sensor histidine kinase/response regulator
MYRFIYSFAIVLFSFSAISQAEENYRISRYATINPVATPEQAKPLSVVVSLDFTDQVRTVGEALQHLLSRSGYQLADLNASDPALPILLKKPLPLIHRKLGPITIENALVTLAGDAWNLVVDPVNRLVSFDLLEQYRSFVVN